ncbi:MAG: exonuclease SbcCD subunit D [Oscillospiraceae bacterium]|nr:exonuclease SbcCD subunit D [Oscillospiraceae bacterium]
MKLIHLSDLHLGKRLNEHNLIDDQRDILQKILRVVDSEKPDAILMAGDVYDRSIPPAEAVQLLDDFLTRLAQRNLPTFLISGNHDSPERVSFGAALMKESGIHIAPLYDGRVTPVTLSDEFGTVNLYSLPFVKPVHVRECFPDAEISSYTDALRVAVEQMNVPTNERNVLIAHQFVTGNGDSETPERSDSEVSVGGLDNVDLSVFAPFDYVALGHIHKPQYVGRESVRYCGTPLKYSFSEVRHEKSVTVVELGAKGVLKLRTIPLEPLREMRELRGTLSEILSRERDDPRADDYFRVILTDEDEIPDAIGKLRTRCPNVLRLEYDNARTRAAVRLDAPATLEGRTPVDLFGEFYEQQNNRPMSDEQRRFCEQLMEEIQEAMS